VPAILNKPEIRAHLDKEIAERSKRTGINADRVIRELARIALVNPTDLINMSDASINSEASRDDTAAILSVKVKKGYSETGDYTEREVRTHDKIKALELLGKHLGMFTDRLNVTGEIVQIIDDVPKRSDMK